MSSAVICARAWASAALTQPEATSLHRGANPIRGSVFQIHRACGVMGLKEESGLKKMIEFDNIIGGQDGGVAELVAKGNPFQLKVTRHDDGQYSLTVSRRNPDGKKHALVHFWLTHAEGQAIANLAEAP